MPGLFTQAGRVYADTRRKTQELQQADADRKYQEEQRAIQRLAVMEGLRGQGLVPDQEAQQMRGAVQAAKASDFLTPGTDMSGVETPQVQQAGAGFSRVSTMTPEYRQQVMARRKQQDAEAQRGRRVAVLRAKKVGADDNERAAIAEDDSLYESYLKPQPPKRYSHVTTAEGVFSFDPETGNKGARIGGRPVAPSGTGAVPAKERRSYIAQRARELMRPQSGDYGMKEPGMPFAQAQQQAKAEADEIYGPGGGTATAAPSKVTGLDAMPEEERALAAKYAEMIQSGTGTLDQLRESQIAQQKPHLVAVVRAMLKRQ